MKAKDDAVRYHAQTVLIDGMAQVFETLHATNTMDWRAWAQAVLEYIRHGDWVHAAGSVYRN